jgi:hypothetical protein
MTRRQALQIAASAPALAAGAAAAAESASDPFLGDYQGARAGARPTPVCAQVFPLGKGEYQINLTPEFDERCPPYASLTGRLEGGSIRFQGAGWSGAVSAERIAGESLVREKPLRFELKKTMRTPPRLGEKPPKGALVLFDGGDLKHWSGVNQRFELGAPIWKSVDGVLRATPVERKPEVMRHLTTTRAFPYCRLHVEFRSPLMAEARGQLRGNSGIVFEDYAYHELQILDSYGLPGYYDDCGSIYKVAAPMINMCAPPTYWQTYDITYRAPRYDSSLKLVSPGRITVDHNGKLIHKDFELPDSAAAEKLRRESPGSRKPGRIRLTYHNDPVQFRNIWALYA